jgi:nicotinamidase-related amidase
MRPEEGHDPMLSPESVVLVVVDIQGKLAHLMQERESLFASAVKIIRGARALDIPVIWMEQNPEGLGPTVPEISEHLRGLRPIPKLSFSCGGSPEFIDRLESLRRRQVLLAGIEAHVCVYQTAADLLKAGYEVLVVVDAVSSRSARDREVALARMKDLGASLTTTEMALFEILKVAKGPKFKEILEIVK